MQEGIRFDTTFESMPWHKVDCVIFDIGNVLINYAPDDFIVKLFPDDPEKQQQILKRVYEGKYWPMFDRGTMSYEEAAERLEKEYGGSREDYLRAMYGWIELKTPIEEGWRTVSRCKRAGKQLWLLSNYAEAGYTRLREKFRDLFAAFDGATVSCYYHQCKPEKEIYETLIRESGIEPGRALFIDDTLTNVEGALHAGINGFHRDRPGKMDEFFL